MSDVITPPPAPPAVPPTEPFTYAAPRPSGWPMVLGVLAIILAILGLLSAAWSAFAPLIRSALGRPAYDSEAVRAIFERYAWWTHTSAIVGGALAILLLATGIGFVSRRAWSRGLGQAWGMLRILFVLVGTFASYRLNRELFPELVHEQEITSAPASLPVASLGATFAGASACFGLVLGWAPPVFLLIWLARHRIREEMAGWAGRPAGAA